MVCKVSGSRAFALVWQPAHNAIRSAPVLLKAVRLVLASSSSQTSHFNGICVQPDALIPASASTFQHLPLWAMQHRAFLLPGASTASAAKEDPCPILEPFHRTYTVAPHSMTPLALSIEMHFMTATFDPAQLGDIASTARARIVPRRSGRPSDSIALDFTGDLHTPCSGCIALLFAQKCAQLLSHPAVRKIRRPDRASLGGVARSATKVLSPFTAGCGLTQLHLP
jgi:hypothetical protein